MRLVSIHSADYLALRSFHVFNDAGVKPDAMYDLGRFDDVYLHAPKTFRRMIGAAAAGAGSE